VSKGPHRPGRRRWTFGQYRSLSWLFWAGYTALLYVVSRATPGDLRWALLVAGPLTPLLVFGAVRRAITAYDRECAPALASLRRGDPERAEVGLRAMQKRFHWPPFLSRLTSYNLAQALLRQGRHPEAIEALSDSDRRGGAKNIDPAIAGTLALVHALAGNLELAEEWLVESHRRYAGRITATPFPVLQSEVVVDLRRGRSSQVLRRLEGSWEEIEHSMKGETLRPVALLRAFAAAESGGLREAGTLERTLARLRPVRPGEFRYLAVAWPALEVFLQMHLPEAAAAG
jgi:hypothetical protein